ncbi:MAG TPA: 3-methyl-2-oxobutanoate hydroxymethyltransferase [Thiobacillaceae bacterium]|nr:3-methyl-2-oxobutanoate hydroxymethyltransferase [Thiobacillaceae bacterium]
MSNPTKPITLSTLKGLRERSEKIAVLTAYDAGFARLAEEAGVEVILVGDSLGMVVQGHTSTLPVRLAEMSYHTRCVARGVHRALIVSDLPFASYQQSPQQAYVSAARLMAAGANIVKLEGGAVMLETVRFLVQRGIPVCAHLGLLPQSVNQLGGYRVQARDESSANQLLADARALQQAGAGLVVLESIPAALGKLVTESLAIPTVGIGAGPHCSGQVLVLQDVLGIYPHSPKFSKNFMAGAGSIQGAIQAYVAAVKSGAFPGPEHCFQ